MNNSYLSQIETVVGGGRAMISADDSTVVAMVQDTIRSGRSASFYLSPAQANAVKSWYWTPRRIEESGIKSVSSEDRTRIRSELGIEDIGAFRCNTVQCKCGEVYGAFEFLQQGIREHGREAVSAVFGLKDAVVIRANPPLVAICPNCDQMLGSRMTYEGDTYGGCCFGDEE